MCSLPHTTAGVTINENADPDVVDDVLDVSDKLIPERGNYRHSEGNSDSHVKSSLIAPSLMVMVENGRLKLGIGRAFTSPSSTARETGSAGLR